MLTICGECGEPKECREVRGPCHDCAEAIMAMLRRDWTVKGTAITDQEYIDADHALALWEDRHRAPSVAA